MNGFSNPKNILNILGAVFYVRIAALKYILAKRLAVNDECSTESIRIKIEKLCYHFQENFHSCRKNFIRTSYEI